MEQAKPGVQEIPKGITRTRQIFRARPHFAAFVDLHSESVMNAHCGQINTLHLQTDELIVEKIRSLNLKNFVLVSPDYGRSKWVARLAGQLGVAHTAADKDRYAMDKTMVGQVDVLETLTPLEFLSFRAKLESASGFQSYQFRALEFALGKKDPGVLQRFPEGSTGREMLGQRFTSPTLWDGFLAFLAGQGVSVPGEDLGRDVTRPLEPSPALQAVLVDVYRQQPALAAICDQALDLDEGLQEWRYRHVKMVERTIGAKSGTGGSSGVHYLASTLFQPLFPDLWAIRSEL
jgi:tryptophan 2,3-dioxygenase